MKLYFLILNFLCSYIFSYIELPRHSCNRLNTMTNICFLELWTVSFLKASLNSPWDHCKDKCLKAFQGRTLALAKFNFPLIMFISILEHTAMSILSIAISLTISHSWGIHSCFMHVETTYFFLYFYLELNSLVFRKDHENTLIVV